MRTSYELALDNVNLSLGSTTFSQEIPNQDTIVAIGSSLAVFDVHNFSDRMGVDTLISRKSSQGLSLTSADERLLNFYDFFPPLDQKSVGVGSFVGIGSTTPYVGYKTVQSCLENVTKAMLIAVLDGDGKRTSTVGIGSTLAKLKKFFNALTDEPWKDYTVQPWSNWNDSVGVCTPVSIGRSDNIATVTTNPAHGLNTSYDDWGIVLNLNTGIATSFNISTALYPNGVPIKITGNNTFTYENVGVNTNISSVTGIATVHVGWGGTANNFHMKVI